MARGAASGPRPVPFTRRPFRRRLPSRTPDPAGCAEGRRRRQAATKLPVDVNPAPPRSPFHPAEATRSCRCRPIPVAARGAGRVGGVTRSHRGGRVAARQGRKFVPPASSPAAAARDLRPSRPLPPLTATAAMTGGELPGDRRTEPGQVAEVPAPPGSMKRGLFGRPQAGGQGRRGHVTAARCWRSPA